MKIKGAINVKLFVVSSVFIVIFLSASFLKLSANHIYNESDIKLKKVIVLGFDGLDPGILIDLVHKEKLPNFKMLMEKGDFHNLDTSIPPLSPVAWANFITGMNSGGHGIFDFIHRDPNTMIPFLSTSKVQPANKTIRIKDFVIPLSSERIELLREGKPFWQILEEHGIPTTIIRIPANFPPLKGEGRQLSGMGTPDLRGTYGLFSFYTDALDSTFSVDSGGEVYKVQVLDSVVNAKLYGPQNSFHADARPSTVEFTVFIDPVNPIAKIQIQDQQILLQEGEWSPWIRINFEMIPFLKQMRGMVRFFLKEVDPNFKLYASPINIDPSSPTMPISNPTNYSRELHDEIGLFYTQGMPYDTKALSYNIFDDDDFLKQAEIVFDEQTRILDYELNRFKQGLLFFYLGRVDQIGHMFWRTYDPNHPHYENSSKHLRVIENSYVEMDEILGKALNYIDGETTLIVISDHGFAPFYRSFNLNTWLKEEGYINLIEGSDEEYEEYFGNVDWARTKAYGLGLNGLYINLIGREPLGTVKYDMERDELIDEVAEKLLSTRDPKTGEKVVAKVYRPEDIYSGPYMEKSPDLIIGYNRGYRVSWESVLGKFTEEIFKDNTDKWSGDHAMAAELVPGVLLGNKKINSNSPALHDLAPTILNEFGIAKDHKMVGEIIF